MIVDSVSGYVLKPSRFGKKNKIGKSIKTITWYMILVCLSIAARKASFFWAWKGKNVGVNELDQLVISTMLIVLYCTVLILYCTNCTVHLLYCLYSTGCTLLAVQLWLYYPTRTIMYCTLRYTCTVLVHCALLYSNSVSIGKYSRPVQNNCTTVCYKILNALQNLLEGHPSR